ncbi:Gfo/Idh/MocA family oxidoreductase [Paracoccus bogoriensis]|uniref:Gfo/Idh/MocA family protein n=1 Tax=Paracoccus bogoriensis TaxID=242065 RepID=UPI001C680BB9|nr:Gfo/Idh/MocA family oxidoreductase [Paracoccus bogoriensis]MBW7055651.1 Gfo/Idh/MocA family oxidoreductase [Paracoccus bogoriensis]
MSLRIGLVGLGAIARAQHLPAIAATDGLRLSAIASRNTSLEGVANYRDVAQMLGDVDAVSLCTPPQGRFDQAMAVLRAGRHLMLEKPPGATLSEMALLQAEAARQGVTLYATWHSREAAAVEVARDWLSRRSLRATRIDWCEDVRKWHPGQDWIWQPGGLGVFDPGINALSILTTLIPGVRLVGADLHIPANRQTPIAADLVLDAGHPVTAHFDWRATGDETWQIAFDTDAGAAVLSEGGARFTAPDLETAGENREYARLYARFRDLVATGQSDCDLAPLRLVADAFLTGRRHAAPAFED